MEASVGRLLRVDISKPKTEESLERTFFVTQITNTQGCPGETVTIYTECRPNPFHPHCKFDTTTLANTT